MSKHTPGPWIWTNGTDPIDIATYNSPGYHDNAELRAGAELIVGCDEYWILGPYGEDDQMRANAHLIAAAPEMYEALKVARDTASNGTLFRMFADIIAKAEGAK